MLKDQTRNMIVGLTFIVAAAAFVLGIFFLGKLPALGPNAPYRVTVVAPNAAGLSSGDVVSLNGVTIGTVSEVFLPPHYANADIRLSIYQKYTLPTNINAKIDTRTIGTSYVALWVPQPNAPTNLPKDGTAIIQGSTASSSLIPKSVVTDFTSLKSDFGRLSKRLDRVADDLHTLLKPVKLTAAQATGKTASSANLGNLSALVQRLNVTIQSFNRLMADQKLQAQVREIVANAAASSKELKAILTRLNGTVTRANTVLASANHAAANVGKAARSTQRKIAAVSVHLTDLLEHLDTITQTIAAGHGTAGRFVKDPRLYNSLLDLTHELKGTVNDLHALVKQIQANGVKLNLHF